MDTKIYYWPINMPFNKQRKKVDTLKNNLMQFENLIVGNRYYYVDHRTNPGHQSILSVILTRKEDDLAYFIAKITGGDELGTRSIPLTLFKNQIPIFVFEKLEHVLLVH